LDVPVYDLFYFEKSEDDPKIVRRRLIFEPDALLGQTKALAPQTGKLSCLEIPRNDQEFLRFLSEVAELSVAKKASSKHRQS
jgi:hypothetical protein